MVRLWESGQKKFTDDQNLVEQKSCFRVENSKKTDADDFYLYIYEDKIASTDRKK